MKKLALYLLAVLVLTPDTSYSQTRKAHYETNPTTIEEVIEGIDYAYKQAFESNETAYYFIHEDAFETLLDGEVSQFEFLYDEGLHRYFAEEPIDYYEGAVCQIGDVLHNHYSLIITPIKNQMTESMYEKTLADIDKVVASADLENASDYDKIKWAYDYVIDHCTYYRYNIDEMQLNNVYDAFYNKETMCDGFSRLLHALLDALAIENTLVSGKTFIEGHEHFYHDELGHMYTAHMWNAARLDGKWYHLDATYDNNDHAEMSAHLTKNHFLVGSEVYESTRTFFVDPAVTLSETSYQHNPSSDDETSELFSFGRHFKY